MTAPYPEPEGAHAAPGFVKCNPLNNEYYVEQFKDDPWYHIIKWTHEQLNQIIPGYNISQIKEKFGGLRYYIDLPEEVPLTRWADTREKVVAEANRVIRYAEAWVDGFEHHRNLPKEA